LLNFFFLLIAHHQRGNSLPRTFSVTSWQLFALRAPRPLPDGTIRQGFTLLPDSNHTCSHDVTLRIPKQAPRFEGFPT